MSVSITNCHYVNLGRSPDRHSIVIDHENRIVLDSLVIMSVEDYEHLFRLAYPRWAFWRRPFGRKVPLEQCGP